MNAWTNQQCKDAIKRINKELLTARPGSYKSDDLHNRLAYWQRQLTLPLYARGGSVKRSGLTTS